MSSWRKARETRPLTAAAEIKRMKASAIGEKEPVAEAFCVLEIGTGCYLPHFIGMGRGAWEK